jgi:hypothetical protein
MSFDIDTMPLIIYWPSWSAILLEQSERRQTPRLDDHAKHVLNFYTTLVTLISVTVEFYCKHHVEESSCGKSFKIRQWHNCNMLHKHYVLV